MNKTILLAASVLLLSACASTGTRDGLVYRDGSWYAPAADGRGDYYTGSPYGEAWDHPYNFSVGMVPFGGYCPVRYRYCTSFWSDPFFGPRYGAYYDPFYNPYWYQPRVYYRSAPRHRPRAPVADFRPGDYGTHTPARREPTERPQPRSWEEERPPTSSDERPRRRVPVSADE